MIATDAIDLSVPFLKPSDHVYQALEMMADNHIAALPVVKKGKYEGMVTEDILLNMAEDAQISAVQMVNSEVFAKNDEHILTAIKLFDDWKIELIPVIDESDNYVGSITPYKLISLLNQKTWIFEPGGILVLEIKAANYSFSEIARIIESNNATVLYVDTSLNHEKDMVEVTIKVNKTDLKDIIQTLERYNYDVKASYHKSSFDDSLKERYDSLMMYLNV